MKDLTNIEIAGLLETTKNKFNENGKTYAVLTEAQERLISIPMQLPVLKKIADLVIKANEPLLDVVNKARTEIFDVELAMEAFITINKKLKEILDLTKQ